MITGALKIMAIIFPLKSFLGDRFRFKVPTGLLSIDLHEGFVPFLHMILKILLSKR
jgi:hypothetical protein